MHLKGNGQYVNSSTVFNCVNKSPEPTTIVRGLLAVISVEILADSFALCSWFKTIEVETRPKTVIY